MSCLRINEIGGILTGGVFIIRICFILSGARKLKSINKVQVRSEKHELDVPIFFRQM